jgi:hypothetical protein
MNSFLKEACGGGQLLFLIVVWLHVVSEMMEYSLLCRTWIRLDVPHALAFIHTFH